MSVLLFRLIVAALCGAILAPLPAAPALSGATPTPLLRVHPANPRYFTADGSAVVCLTGSHTWHVLQDYSTKSYPPAPFDFAGFISTLRSHGHNFFRLWTWEQQRWDSWSPSDDRWYSPSAYARVPGGGAALDGLPKYDLTRYNPDYFQRLRERVAQARRHGMYVAVMLFQGVSVAFKRDHYKLPWQSHPYHAANNINGVDADTNGDGQGYDFHQWPLAPRVWDLQQAYIRQVIATVNAFDNVLYEVANECHPRSEEWQYQVIYYIKACEATRPQQHLVGMTAEFPAGGTADLYASPADWISPSGSDWDPQNPPIASGRKVVLADTDHMPGARGDRRFVWKAFMRGNHPIYMDDFTKQDAERLGARQAMGHTLSYARRLPLARMVPTDRAEDCSSTYLLRAPGRCYLAYHPGGPDLTLDLPAGDYATEIFDPSDGSSSTPSLSHPQPGPHTFTRPAHAADDWVLLVQPAPPRPALSP